MGRARAILLCLALGFGCSAPERPAEIEPGSGIPPGPRKEPFGPFERVAHHIGSEPGPTEVLTRLKALHDPVDDTHRLVEEDAAEQCREAVEELRERDYATWQVASYVISRVSRLATRDPSALVREEALDTLFWFDGWVRPIAERNRAARPSRPGDVIDALRNLRVLRELPPEHRTSARRQALLVAVEVLGAHRWEEGAAGGKGLAKTRLAQAQRVAAGLVDGRLSGWRRDGRVREALDRASIRIAAQIIRLTFLAQLDDEVPFVRIHAVRLLESTSGAGALEAFARTLSKDEDPAARLALIEAIGRTASGVEGADRIVASGLASALYDSDESLRRAAARALVGVVGESEAGDDPAAWRRWWERRGRERGRR